MVEFEGNISKHNISILIYLGSSHNYITPRMVKLCDFNKTNHGRSLLVQLATRAKRKVNQLVNIFPLEMNGLFTREYLNIMPLGSYDLLIRMDWLEALKLNI